MTRYQQGIDYYHKLIQSIGEFYALIVYEIALQEQTNEFNQGIIKAHLSK